MILIGVSIVFYGTLLYCYMHILLKCTILCYNLSFHIIYSIDEMAKIICKLEMKLSNNDREKKNKEQTRLEREACICFAEWYHLDKNTNYASDET